MPRSEPVYRITEADTSLTDEQRGRIRRYAFSMAVRTICFLGAIVASGVLRWILVLGAVLLPYVAVVFANAGREYDSNKPGRTVFARRRRTALPGSGSGPQGPAGGSGPPADVPTDRA